RQIVAQRHRRKGAEGNDSLLVPLSQHADGLLLQVDFVFVEPDELADTQPARIEQLENGPIAQRLQGSALRHLDHGGGFSLSKERWKFFRQPWRGDELGRVCLQAAIADHELEERFQASELSRYGALGKIALGIEVVEKIPKQQMVCRFDRGVFLFQ